MKPTPTTAWNAGQTISFRMDQPIEGRVIKMLAQREGMTQFVGEERRINLLPRLGQQPYGDQALGIEIAHADLGAVLRGKLDQRARSKRLRGGVHDDLVGERPGRARTDAAAFAWAQTNDGETGQRGACLLAR